MEDAIELLTNGRDERCAHERAIRLFQFHTWMWFPGKTKMNAPKTTGRLASALILRHIQRERFGKGGEITIARQKSLFGDLHYRKIYSQFIAPTGGWSNQLRCSLKDADHRLDNRRSKSGHIIVDLMDYRVRQVLSPTGDPTKSKISHAVFFNCWLARAQHNSSPTGRTMWSWWGKLQSSSMFIYLSEKLGPLVHDMGLNDKDFLERITAAAEDEKALTRFFATYSFLRQAFANVDDFIYGRVLRLD